MAPTVLKKHIVFQAVHSLTKLGKLVEHDQTVVVHLLYIFELSCITSRRDCPEWVVGKLIYFFCFRNRHHIYIKNSLIYKLKSFIYS
jgi:hypothetical protein